MAAALLGACTAAPDSQTAGRAPVESPPKEAQSLDAAVASMTTALFARAQLDPSERRVLVVDPPVDQATVNHTAMTRAVERRILSVAGQRVPNVQPSPLDSSSLERRPVLVLSCMTPVAAPGAMPTSTDAPPKVYRIWASLSDLRTGKIISYETAWVRAEDADVTPTPFFRDSPAWAMDRSMQAYRKVCGGKPGETMDPVYLNGMEASVAANDATRAYEGGRYQEALALYDRASLLPGGDRMRVWNGIYLASVALGRPQEAEEAFGRMVDAGLAQGRLAVKFVFLPASTRFWPDPAVSGQYPLWLRQIARHTAERQACILVVGHTSPSGAPALNDILSERRAQVVRADIVRRAPMLQARTEARGRGAREPLIGTGRDDATDLLDRRVEFEPRACDTLRADRALGHTQSPRRG